MTTVKSMKCLIFYRRHQFVRNLLAMIVRGPESGPISLAMGLITSHRVFGILNLVVIPRD